LSPILFNFNKEVLEWFEDFKIRGQIIRKVIAADDLMLFAKVEIVLQGIIGRLIETGRRYGMEMNVEN
jgi:Glu-tRNA(Gln) amidotransferase subunit E-like FAD-binding protein